jgi:hypothetical protein
VLVVDDRPYRKPAGNSGTGHWLGGLEVVGDLVEEELLV